MEKPGIREHVKDVKFGLGGIDIIWGSKSGIVLPKTLPFGLYFVERVSPSNPQLLLLLLFTRFFLSHRASNRSSRTATDSEIKGFVAYSEKETGFSNVGGGVGEFPRAKRAGENRRRWWKRLHVEKCLQMLRVHCCIVPTTTRRRRRRS